MKSLFQLATLLEKIVNFLGRIGAWMMIPLMLVIVYDVIMRHFFVIGSTQLQELEWHLHGALFLLCLGWAYNRNSHVRIEILYDTFKVRSHALIELLGCLLFLIPYSVALIYFGVDYFGASYMFDEHAASATGLPNRWIIKGIMVLGFSTLFMAGLSRTLMVIAFLFGGKEFARNTGFEEENIHIEKQGGAS